MGPRPPAPRIPGPAGAAVRHALLAAAVATAAALLIPSCEDQLGHPFGAYPYDVEGDCLGAPGVIDVIEGAAPPPCKRVRCFESPTGDVYITDTACDAPPDFVERTGATSGLCVKAVAAYYDANHGRCPRAPHDGGAGGASPDAGAGGVSPDAGSGGAGGASPDAGAGGGASQDAGAGGGS